MSFFDSLLKLLSSLFGGAKQAQPAEQIPPEEEDDEPVRDSSVEAYISATDPRVKQTNKGLGLVTQVVTDPNHPGHFTITHANGMVRDLGTDRPVPELIQFGIDISVNPHLEYVLTAIRNGRDLSRYTEQEIFDARVYLGKYVIEK